MNQSKIEIGQPEENLTNEQKADNQQVSPSIANAVLAEVPGGLNSLSKAIFLRNKEKWNYPANRNIGEVLCLLHSEISEALEADRKGLYTKYPIGLNMNDCTDDEFAFKYKAFVKGFFEEEMADILIRLLDLCGSKNIDIDSHLKAKLRYTFMSNETNGKKY
jgi:hypothetical protein